MQAHTQPASPATQTFYSVDYHYSVQTPANWHQLTHDTVDRAVGFLRRKPATQNLTWEAAFQPAPMDMLMYPYVILQVAPYSTDRQPSESEMQEAVKAMSGNNFKKISGSTGNAVLDRYIAGANLTTTQYDVTNHVVYQTMMMPVGMGRQIKGLVVSHFGRRAIVSVMCYADVHEFPEDQKQFDQIISSFKFDPSDALQKGINTNWILVAVAIGAAIVVGIIILTNRRPAAPKTPPSYPSA